jgi:extradiol dioxygenase family protein
MTRPRFHLAFAVDDLAKAREFYGGILRCREGRSSQNWVDFDLFDHQIVAHLAPDECSRAQTGAVDGKRVPVRHFGLILGWPEWEELGERIRSSGVDFVIEPYIRFAGEAGEQGTFFIRDPAGNALEFKTFKDQDLVFAS